MLSTVAEKISDPEACVQGTIFLDFIAPGGPARTMTLNVQRHVEARMGADKLRRICGDMREPLKRNIFALCNDRRRHGWNS